VAVVQRVRRGRQDQREQHRRLLDPPDRLELDLPGRLDPKVHRACKVSKERLDRRGLRASRERKGTKERKALLDRLDRKVFREFRELPVSRDQRVLEQRDQQVLEQRDPKDRREFKVSKEQQGPQDHKGTKECKGTKERKGRLDQQDPRVCKASRVFRDRPETPGQLGTRARQVPERPDQREQQAR
jgi:hypothetical protein